MRSAFDGVAVNLVEFLDHDDGAVLELLAGEARLDVLLHEFRQGVQAQPPESRSRRPRRYTCRRPTASTSSVTAWNLPPGGQE